METRPTHFQLFGKKLGTRILNGLHPLYLTHDLDLMKDLMALIENHLGSLIMGEVITFIDLELS